MVLFIENIGKFRENLLKLLTKHIFPEGEFEIFKEDLIEDLIQAILSKREIFGVP